MEGIMTGSLRDQARLIAILEDAEWCLRIGSFVHWQALRVPLSIEALADATQVDTGELEDQVDGARCLPVDDLSRVAAFFGYDDLSTFLRAVIDEFPPDAAGLSRAAQELAASIQPVDLD